MILTPTGSHLKKRNALAPAGPRFIDKRELQEDYDDIPVWDDWRLAVVARGETEERDSLLNHLLHLTLSSLSSYEEIAELAMTRQLHAFANVMLRQRLAQYNDLRQRVDYVNVANSDEDHAALTKLRAVWRRALWNLEQDELVKFAQFAEQAETLLEEAFLQAAAAFHDHEWQNAMQSFAVMVCGARSVWEELANELVETESKAG